MESNKTITKDQIKTLSLSVALRFHLLDFDMNEDPAETYNKIGKDEEIIIWEPFEFWEIDSIKDSIWNLANCIFTTFVPELIESEKI